MKSSTEQNKLDYELSKRVFESKKIKELSDAGHERLYKELEIITKTHSAEIILKSLEMAEFCKENHEEYYLSGVAASLLVFYILGISHVNPLETGLAYEMSIGTVRRPSALYMVSFTVQRSFKIKLQQFCVKINNKYLPYNRYDDNGVLYFDIFAFVYPFEDISKYVRENEYGGLKLLSYQYFDQAYSFEIKEFKSLNDVYEILEKDRKYKNHASFNDLIDLVSMKHRLTVNNSKLCPIYDRDTLFLYFLKCGYSQEISMRLTKIIRVGSTRTMKPEDIKLIEGDYKKFQTILYLPCRAESAEMLYYCLNNPKEQ